MSTSSCKRVFQVIHELDEISITHLCNLHNCVLVISVCHRFIMLFAVIPSFAFCIKLFFSLNFKHQVLEVYIAGSLSFIQFEAYLNYVQAYVKSPHIIYISRLINLGKPSVHTMIKILYDK